MRPACLIALASEASHVWFIFGFIVTLSRENRYPVDSQFSADSTRLISPQEMCEIVFVLYICCNSLTTLASLQPRSPSIPTRTKQVFPTTVHHHRQGLVTIYAVCRDNYGSANSKIPDAAVKLCLAAKAMVHGSLQHELDRHLTLFANQCRLSYRPFHAFCYGHMLVYHDFRWMLSHHGHHRVRYERRDLSGLKDRRSLGKQVQSHMCRAEAHNCRH